MSLFSWHAKTPPTLSWTRSPMQSSPQSHMRHRWPHHTNSWLLSRELKQQIGFLRCQCLDWRWSNILTAVQRLHHCHLTGHSFKFSYKMDYTLIFFYSYTRPPPKAAWPCTLHQLTSQNERNKILLFASEACTHHGQELQNHKMVNTAQSRKQENSPAITQPFVRDSYIPVQFDFLPGEKKQSWFQGGLNKVILSDGIWRFHFFYIFIFTFFRCSFCVCECVCMRMHMHIYMYAVLFHYESNTWDFVEKCIWL